MRTLQNIRLLPVMQLYPPDMGHIQTSPLDTNAYHDFWKKAMKENGLNKVEPIQKGLFYVDLASFNDEDLIQWINLHLEGFEEMTNIINEENKEEYLPHSLPGGVILMEENEILIPPQCCVSFQDYKEWTNIKNTSVPELLWIGHPWIYYKMEGTYTYFSRLIEKDFQNKWRYYDFEGRGTMIDNWIDYTEKEGEIIEEVDFRFRLKTTRLQKAIEQLELETIQFKKRLEYLCKQLNFKYPKLIAQSLIDGNGHTFSYNREDLR